MRLKMLGRRLRAQGCSGQVLFVEVFDVCVSVLRRFVDARGR